MMLKTNAKKASLYAVVRSSDSSDSNALSILLRKKGPANVRMAIAKEHIDPIIISKAQKAYILHIKSEIFIFL